MNGLELGDIRNTLFVYPGLRYSVAQEEPSRVTEPCGLSRGDTEGCEDAADKMSNFEGLVSRIEEALGECVEFVESFAL